MATERKRVLVSLTEELARQLEKASQEMGLSKTAITTLALIDWFDRREKKAPETETD